MRLFLLSLWVILMPIIGFAKAQSWEEFNSSLLIEVTRKSGVFTCTGVAVSKTLIVTAAHCLDGDVEKVRIFTGSVYNAKDPSLEVSKFKTHPDYHPNDSRYLSDIAKIYLKDSLPDSINILPIYKDKEVKGDLYRFGFGSRNKTNIRTVITPTFKNIFLDEKIVELNDTYSYSGDSGGPIFLKKGSEKFVLAIHSTLSFGPAGRFSYNPLLAGFQNWIFEN